MDKNYIESYLEEVERVAKGVDRSSLEEAVKMLLDVREKRGRLFIIGVGGSAANASHAVNDFRKTTGIEAYAPTDNVAELTARVNDDGWETVFVGWLKGSKLNQDDVVFVFSVGGGNAEKNVSMNIVKALEYAKSVGARVMGIVSRDGGYTKQVADVCIMVPFVNPDNVTAHAESFQAVLWHSLVFHPQLKMREGKWEDVQKK